LLEDLIGFLESPRLPQGFRLIQRLRGQAEDKQQRQYSNRKKLQKRLSHVWGRRFRLPTDFFTAFEGVVLQ
jgi:hypothetical protein